MGVVCSPDQEHAFDGKISMIRISRDKQLQRDTHRTQFHHDRDINQLIQQGDWRKLYADDTYNFAELNGLIVDYYELDEEAEASLCFRYITHAGRDRKKKFVTLRDNESLIGKTYMDQAGIQHALTIQEILLTCLLPRGTVIQEDVSCDSAFMLQKIPELGEEICRKMPWVPHNQTMYLLMDNAGGHGTKDAVSEYTQILREVYNIEIIQQAPRSPEVNALDLGLWMSTQSWVEKKHRNKTTDAIALSASVQEAWEHLPVDTICKVFNRIPVVLQLIVDHHGANDLVETRRGMIYAPE
jgi:hypothetical protein